MFQCHGRVVDSWPHVMGRRPDDSHGYCSGLAHALGGGLGGLLHACAHPFYLPHSERALRIVCGLCSSQSEGRLLSISLSLCVLCAACVRACMEWDGMAPLYIRWPPYRYVVSSWDEAGRCDGPKAVQSLR